MVIYLKCFVTAGVSFITHHNTRLVKRYLFFLLTVKISNILHLFYNCYKFFCTYTCRENKIITRAAKEYRRGADRSLATKPLAALFRIITTVKRRYPNITTNWIRSHPERRMPARQWSACDCRIFAADAYADPGPPGELPAKLRQYPVTPFETRVHSLPLSVPASEILLGFCPEGEFFWTDRRGHVMLESIFKDPVAEIYPYLATRESISRSKQKWSEVQLGVLPTIWKKKSIFPSRLIKKWAAIHTWDKLPNFRNMSKWSVEVPPTCLLCSGAVESQSHIALCCPHPAMVLLREVCYRNLLKALKMAHNPVVTSHIRTWLSIVMRPTSEAQAQLMLGLLIARPFTESLEQLPASGHLTPGQQQQYLAVLRELCPASLRFLDLMWQLRNSLHGAPNWKREHLSQQCDMDSVLDLLKWPYSSNTTSPLARLTWKQPLPVTTGGNSSSSLLLAARDTCPLGCYFDPPTMPSLPGSNESDEQDASTDSDTDEEDADAATGVSSIALSETTVQLPLPAPEPPPPEGVRRNPSRIARPACTDVSDYALLSMDELLPGRIPDDVAKRLIAQGGPDLIRHPLDHPHMWIRPSHFCPGGGYGLIFRLDTPVPRGYLLGIYCGITNTVMQLSFSEAERQWRASDYVMAYAREGYIVDGDLTSGPTRVNEGFHTTNAFFLYNSNQPWVEIRLKGCGQPGYYEGLANYTDPGRPSSYWTSQRISQLPPASRALCRSFYSAEKRTKIKEGETSNKKKTKKQRLAEAQAQPSRSIEEFIKQS